jgi:integrase
MVRGQRQPTFTSEAMSSIVQRATGQYRVLYALLAATGLRIGEAFGLQLEHISSDFRTLHIRQSVWAGSVQKPKTASAIRDVDLCPILAAVLKDFVAEREEGFIFRNELGKPLAQSNVLRRSLHPVLVSLGVAKAGFHSFRRFRATHLSKSRIPDSLMKFWMRYAATTQTEEYVKLFAEVDYRREVAASIGLGFDLLPAKPIVRIVRKKAVAAEIENAA